MANELATAYVSLIPSMRGASRQIQRELEGGNAGVEQAGRSAGGAFSSGFKKAFAGAAALFAGGQLVGFGKDAIGIASDLNESGTKLQQVFGTATDSVNKFADGGAKALGQSKGAVLDAAATFGVYGKAAGLGDKANAEFSTSLAGLSTDLASFYNVDPGEAMQALASGLRGEAEPLRRFGVLLDDATLRQTALSMGLVKTTKEALTPQQKVLAAQNVIMKQTQVAQGDFARTSGGLANQQRILAAQWTDMKGRLGAGLLPVAVRFTTALNDKLFPALGKVGGAFKSVKKWISDKWNAEDSALFYYYDFTLGVARKWGMKIRDGIEQVKKWLLGKWNAQDSSLFYYYDFTMGAARKWAKVTKGAFDLLINGRYNPRNWPGFDVNSPAINFLADLHKKAKTTLPAVGKQFLEFGRDAGSKIWAQFKETGAALLPTLKSVAETIGNVFKRLFEAFRSLAADAGPALLAVLNPIGVIFKALLPLLPQIASAVGDIVKVVANGLVDAFIACKPLIQAVLNAFSSLLPAVQDLVKAVLPPLVKLFQAIAPALQGIFKALVPVVSWLADKLSKAVTALVPIFKSAFQVVGRVIDGFLSAARGIITFITGIFTGSWRKAWDGIKQIFSGFWNAIKAVGGQMLTWFGQLVGWIWGKIKAGAGQLVAGGKAVLTWLLDGVKAVAGSVWTWFAALPGWIWEKIKAGGSGLVNVGRKILTWIWDGVKAVWSSMWNWFAGLGKLIVGAIGFAFVTLWNAGKSILNWIWDGIKSAASAVWSWFAGIGRAVWDAVGRAWNALMDAGKRLVQGIWEGIKSAWNSVRNWFSGEMSVFEYLMNQSLAGVGAQLRDAAAMLSQLPGRASGGPLNPGWTVVGEQGPELLYTSPAGGMVYSNSQSRRMLAAATPVAAESGPSSFTGKLFLDSGELLGVVRGEAERAFGRQVVGARFR